MCPPVAQHCGHRARLYLHLLARRARRSWATWCPARCCTTMWARASRRGARLPPSAVPGLGGSLLGLGGGVPGRLAARRAAPLHSAPQAGKASAFRGLCMPTSGLCMPMCWIGGPAHGAWEGRSAYPACHAAGLNTQALEPGGTASTARAGGLRADAHRAAGTALRRQAARPAGAHRQACRAAGSGASQRAAHSARWRAPAVMQLQLDVISSLTMRTEAVRIVADGALPTSHLPL